MLFYSWSTSEWRTLSAKPQATLRDRLLLQNRRSSVASALFSFQRPADVAACYSPQVAALDWILNTHYRHLSSALAKEMRVLIKVFIVSSRYLYFCLFPSHPSILLPHACCSITHFVCGGCCEIECCFVQFWHYSIVYSKRWNFSPRSSRKFSNISYHKTRPDLRGLRQVNMFDKDLERSDSLSFSFVAALPDCGWMCTPFTFFSFGDL